MAESRGDHVFVRVDYANDVDRLSYPVIRETSDNYDPYDQQ